MQQEGKANEANWEAGFVCSVGVVHGFKFDYTGPSVKTTSEKIIVNIGVLS